MPLLSDQPDTNYMYHRGECLKYCFQPLPFDIFDTAPTSAEIIITVTGGAFDGDPFTVFGIDYFVSDTPAYTGNSFSGLGSTTDVADNIYGFLTSNPYITSKANIIRISATEIKIIAIGCGYNNYFIEAQNNWDDVAGVSVAITQGDDGGQKKNYSILVALAKNGLRITPFHAATPVVTCDSVGKVCVDFSKSVSVKKIVPAFYCETGKRTLDEYSIIYQYNYLGDQCQQFFGPIQISDSVKVFDGILADDDLIGIPRYNPNIPHPEIDLADYLGHLPHGLDICCDSNISLAFFGYTVGDGETFAVSIKKTLLSGAVVTEVLTSTNSDIGTFDIAEFDIYTIDVSPECRGIDCTQVKSYTIEIGKFLQDSLSFSPKYRPLVLNIVPCCCNSELYFLSKMNAICTIANVCITEITGYSDYNNFCITDFCDDETDTKTVVTNNARNVILRFDTPQGSDQIRYILDMKGSGQIWIRDTDKDGNYIRRRFIPESGGLIVYSKSEIISVEVTGKII